MEATIPFDLNQAIQRWRENLGQSPAFRSENLFELESHLRDSVAALQRQGLSDEEALLVATKRLGTAASLESEFAKRNGQLIWLDRVLWILVGAQIWTLAGAATHFLGLLIGIVIPDVNSWLKVYGFGQIPGDVVLPVGRVIIFPLLLLNGARFAILANRWFQARGKSPVNYVQQRPRLLTAIFALLCFSPSFLYLSNLLLIRIYGAQRVYAGLGSSAGWTYGMQVLSVILLSVLVFELARKRQRLCRS